MNRENVRATWQNGICTHRSADGCAARGRLMSLRPAIGRATARLTRPVARGDSVRGSFSTQCEASCDGDDDNEVERAAHVCDAQRECAGPLECLRSQTLPTVATCH